MPQACSFRKETSSHCCCYGLGGRWDLPHSDQMQGASTALQPWQLQAPALLHSQHAGLREATCLWGSYPQHGQIPGLVSSHQVAVIAAVEAILPCSCAPLSCCLGPAHIHCPQTSQAHAGAYLAEQHAPPSGAWNPAAGCQICRMRSQAHGSWSPEPRWHCQCAWIEPWAGHEC